MPLAVEIRVHNTWAPISVLSPGAQPGSISNNTPDGKREIYLFECAADDQSSTISKSEAGIDFLSQDRRKRVIESVRKNVIATLREGDAPFEITVRTDISSDLRVLRFKHVMKH